MRILLAGASGVVGRLIPLLVADGHEVAGMTRSSKKTDMLRELGAEPVVCDVYDADALNEHAKSFETELVMHQLTDLPDTADQISAYRDRNNRMRTKGTRNLIAAMRAAGADRLIAQSSPGGRRPAARRSRSTSGWCSTPGAS